MYASAYIFKHNIKLEQTLEQQLGPHTPYPIPLTQVRAILAQLQSWAPEKAREEFSWG